MAAKKSTRKSVKRGAKKAVKKAVKKATKKKTPKKAAKKKTRVQRFKCPHCKKTIAVIDLESIKDTAAVSIQPNFGGVDDPGGPFLRTR